MSKFTCPHNPLNNLFNQCLASVRRESRSMKEKFEAWYLENWGCTEDNLDSLFEESPHGNEYYRFGVRLAWQAWQAATKQSEARCAELAADSKKLKRIRKAIRLLNVVKSRQRWHSNCRAQMLHLRNGTDGILGATDEHAIAYSNIDMRREFLQSVLDDRPVNWAYARYLENGEWLERCNISRKAFYAQLSQEAK